MAAQAQRSTISLNFDWAFSRDSLFSQTETVQVPHDFQIGQPWVAPAADEKADNSDAAANIKSRLSARGFKEIGTGWYRKVIHVDEGLKGRRVLLDFEGIMLTGDVFLNGQRVGGSDYGYVGFEVDVTRQLRYGEPNEIRVKAETQDERASRWYTGGGLFRDVNLVTTSSELYLERHPLYITTRENRYVNVGVEFTNQGRQKEVTIGLRIYGPDGACVYEGKENFTRRAASRTQEVRMKEVEIADAKLWDTEHPNLYRAEVTLMRQDGTPMDNYSESFGIRTIEYNPHFGLKLNGKKLLLQGYANHHTLGALGAAAYPRAIEKRLRLMKEFGINHIRTSHNPYSRQFVELCDKYGILVVNELYDKWTQQHSGNRAPFMNHWAYDVSEWVKRDRNSPSVVMWSFGNELQQNPHQPFNDWGVTCYKMMKTVLQRYDSTRKVTVAMHPRYRNWETDSLPCDLAMQTDIQSYNYRYMYFPGDGRRFPWMTFYQSEASTQSMGENFFGMDLEKVIGLAYWGAIDYLGESMGWPAKGWSQGVFYLSLDPKPKAYFMRSMFRPDEPLVHLAVLESEKAEMWNGVKMGNDRMTENWNRPEGSKANIYVYTNGDEVELRLNGKSLGRQPNPTAPKLRNQIRWGEIDYQKGRLEAIAYKGGKPIARHALETTGQPVRIIAEPDNQHWLADGMDLQHITLTAVDSKGRRVLNHDDELTFSLEGEASIIAVTNGDITSNEIATEPHIRLWQGQAMVILRSGRQPSNITLHTKTRAFKEITTRLETQTAGDEVLTAAQRTNDYFMTHYADPTQATNVGRIRPSSLWTRAVYYEGLMALHAIDPQPRYIDYAMKWADFHKWTPRNGVKTCNADDQCCGQTYVELLPYTKQDYSTQLANVIANLDYQMQTPNIPKKGKATTDQTEGNLYGWWTWIDAIQMAMPLYLQIAKLTGQQKYRDHAMKMYRWTRDECGNGLLNQKEGLWWRDADYVPPYKEKDGKNCYWSRGNGWVYAALVRCMSQLAPTDKEYKELRKDFQLMSQALYACQHEDGFWHASLVSDAEYPDPEMTGTALFLYGMAWGIQQGILKSEQYRPACDRAWNALRSCLHADGSLGWNQGTGKEPSAGQPVTFTSKPDFEDYGTGCYLLALSEYYKLCR